LTKRPSADCSSSVDGLYLLPDEYLTGVQSFVVSCTEGTDFIFPDRGQKDFHRRYTATVFIKYQLVARKLNLSPGMFAVKKISPLKIGIVDLVKLVTSGT
jgi:hypothetical protein